MLLETQLFPPIATWSLAYHFGKITWEANETYQKNSFRNRYYIGTWESQLCMSVPLKKGKHNQCPITEVEIFEPEKWPSKHWQAIQSSYGKFPYFEHYAHDVREVLTSNFKKLWELNGTAFQCINDALGLSIQTQQTQSYNTSGGPDEDWRGKINPKSEMRSDQAAIYSWSFISKMSILDLIFSKGPETEVILANIGNLLFR